VLRKDASFLGHQIAIRCRESTPHWDANCGIVGTIVLRAFGIALRKVQARYNLDPPAPFTKQEATDANRYSRVAALGLGARSAALRRNEEVSEALDVGECPLTPLRDEA
jgi:hypothetical protein